MVTSTGNVPMNSLQRLLSNTVLAYLSNVIAKASISVLFILIGRSLGPSDAGVFNLGITYFTIVFGLSAFGLQELLVREVAPRRDQSKQYLSNYLFMRVAITVLTYAILLGALYLLLPYSDETKKIIAVISLAVFPEAAFSLCQAIFEAHERLRVPAYASVSNSAVRLLGGWWVLQSGANPTSIAWLIPLGSFVGLLSLAPALFRLLREVSQEGSAYPNLTFIRRQLRYTPSFLVIHFFSIVDYQADTFLISVMLSETAVGWYGAAQTILLGFWIMPVAIRAALYPLMARYYVHAPNKLAVLYEKASQYLMIAVLPMVVGVFLLAEQIILLVFGASFTPSIPVLRWSIWGVIFVFLNVPNARLMLVHNRQRVLSWMTGLSMVVNVGLNLLLIPLYGIVGAAMSRLFASFILFATIYVYVHLRISPGFQHLRQLPRLIIATSLMAMVVILLRDMPLILPVFSGAVIFILASLLIGVVPAKDWTYWQQLLKGVNYTE